MSRAALLQATCLSALALASMITPVGAADPNLTLNKIDNGPYTLPGNISWNDIRVGNIGGPAALKIYNSAQVNSTNGYLGFAPTSSDNTAIVTDAGTLWTIQQILGVGKSGARNTLTIEKGAKVKTQNSIVGQDSNNNTITVTGSDAGGTDRVASTLENTGYFQLGLAGSSNTLNILDGGKVTATNSYIGDAAGSQKNTATVSGTGSIWSMFDSLYIGNNGTENGLTVTMGGEVKANSLSLGQNAIANDNTASVKDADSKIDLFFELNVGYRGDKNTLTLSNGGQAKSSFGYIGRNSTANGNSVSVTSGAKWDVTSEDDDGSLFVGFEGSENSLSVSEGGIVDSKGRLVIGGNPKANNYGGGANSNSVTIMGSADKNVDTRLTSAGITVGAQGDNNKMTVRSRGLLETKGNSKIGNGQNTNNSVTVTGTGSLWNLNSNLEILGNAPPPPQNLVIPTDGAPQNMTVSAAASESPNRLSIQDGGRANVGGDLTVTGDGKIDLWAGGSLYTNTLKLADNSVLSVYIDDKRNSSVLVNGNAKLDGDLNVKIGANDLLSNSYIVLVAGSLDGTFDNLDFDYNEDFKVSILENAKLDYSDKHVTVLFKANIGGNDGLNINQSNVANAVSSYYNAGGKLPESFLPMLLLKGGDLTSMLEQTSGEVGSTGGANQMKAAAGGFTNVMIENSSQPNGINIAAAEMGDVAIMPTADVAPSSGWTMWGSAFGGKSSLPGGSTPGSHDTDTDLIGLATGWDYALSSDATVGFAIAGGGTRWDLDKGLGNGESTFLQLGARGSQRFGASYLSLAGAYAWHWMETERTALSETLTADFAASSLAGRLEGGHRLGGDGSFGLTPYAALAAQASFLPDYTETGGSAALAFEERTSTSVRSELGLKLDVTADALRLDAGLAWAHDFSEDDAAEASFRSLPGASFVVNGAEAPENLALVTAGAEFGLGSQTSLAARFDGEFGKDYTTYGGTLALSYNW